ncbi:hypothetical protein [Vibrio campbellii]|uniref:hypothetical protein n=1 Tax=Vibrio campbellii TaxID=680 RepID=UPI001F46F37A|nr:hypothetical protein [Vibrio campbellii]MCE7730532.1 hypothetical protein [Vibrio campbellii]
MNKMITFSLIFLSTCSFAESSITQEQKFTEAEGPYCQYSLEANGISYGFSFFDSCGTSDLIKLNEELYLVDLTNGNINSEAYFIFDIEKKEDPKEIASLNLSYDIYDYGFDIIGRTLLDKDNGKIIKNADNNYAGVLSYIFQVNNFNMNVPKDRILYWNRNEEENYCSSTIVFSANYGEHRRDVCWNSFSSRYEYVDIIEGRVNLRIKGEFDGKQFKFDNNGEKLTINPYDGKYSTNKTNDEFPDEDYFNIK